MMGNTEVHMSGSDSPSPTPSFGYQQTLFHSPGQGPGGDKFDHSLQHHGISDHIFEAVSSVQPISASFGDMTNPDPFGPPGAFRS
ncbi:hypothetical protein M406DRAFT_358180 [Cryphonectria parasitica EP155]|uniref:Uncharacterized protein n=1 Tax=Cryphonectria parasitica (strain ATCC 38755 / EP155) TaxID=660469 RepID=A0A9P4XTM4_CRYP1|nr:uncharacterized protein M406DRAFT_358180 [Cryphonectria parasitica EP155]KAF3760440.1 hypothetical protein M406DRAFT_358180 [Cryphonectria parasitica EP155]